MIDPSGGNTIYRDHFVWAVRGEINDPAWFWIKQPHLYNIFECTARPSVGALTQSPTPTPIPVFISLDNYIVTVIQSEWNDSVAWGSGRPLICPHQALNVSNKTINRPVLQRQSIKHWGRLSTDEESYAANHTQHEGGRESCLEYDFFKHLWFNGAKQRADRNLRLLNKKNPCREGINYTSASFKLGGQTQ